MSAMTGLEIIEMVAEGFVPATAQCATCAAETEHMVGEVDGAVEVWCTGCQADEAMPELTVEEAIAALDRASVFAVHGTYWPGA